MITQKQIYEKMLSMWEKMSSGVMKATKAEIAALGYKLHAVGMLECDSDNCGKCYHPSKAEIKEAKAAVNE